jgi:hypothetical protein
MTTTPALLAYLQGLISLDTLPGILTFDHGLWQAMDDLWQRSVARLKEGIVVEWGGLLELWRRRLQLVRPVSGTAEGLRLIVPLGSRFIGSFHTHPHPAGHTGIGFSGADFADTANQGERISLVQSGQHIFMLLHTEGTPSNLDVDEWRSRMNTLFERAYRERRNVLQASLIANKAICQDLVLALYYGHVFRRLVEVYRP